MERNFDMWINTFRESISDYKYYTDFNKVYQKVDDIRIELNILNSLIGSKNIKSDFINLISIYPQVLKCIPILLAVRKNEIYTLDIDGENKYIFNKNPNVSLEQYCVFMQKTGLFDLIENHIINNLVDYVTGVEAGLGSNGRKNRGGHLMENLVENFIQKLGFIKGKTFFKEITIREIEELFGVYLSAISNNGNTVKRFDFIIINKGVIYAIETNFYASSSSKLNETARSYKMIAIESRQINNFEFVWITDGAGWLSTKKNLKETFDVMNHIYNIYDMQSNGLGVIFGNGII